MLSNTLNHPEKPAALAFNRVGENLNRLEPSGKYYGWLKRGGKQFRRSPKTTDRKLSERRQAEFRKQMNNLSPTEDANV